MTIKKDEPKTSELTGKESAVQFSSGEAVIPLVTQEAAPYIAPLIYLGPNLPGGVLSGNTVFKGGKPAHIDLLISAQPEIGDLIVPVKEINDTLAKINKIGTAEHQAYQALQKRGTGAVNGV